MLMDEFLHLKFLLFQLSQVKKLYNESIQMSRNRTMDRHTSYQESRSKGNTFTTSGKSLTD